MGDIVDSEEILPNPNRSLMESNIFTPQLRGSSSNSKIQLPEFPKKRRFSSDTLLDKDDEISNRIDIFEKETSKPVKDCDISGRDWNEEFQHLIESVFDSVDAIGKLRQLIEDFEKIAKKLVQLLYQNYLFLL